MADDRNKQMDQLLRDYARERRKGADPRLHPATRKMLHGEIARKYGAPVQNGFWMRWRAFWPQIAFATGLCAILLVATLSLRQSSRPQKAGSGEPGLAPEMQGAPATAAPRAQVNPRQPAKDPQVPSASVSLAKTSTEVPAKSKAAEALSNGVLEEKAERKVEPLLKQPAQERPVQLGIEDSASQVRSRLEEAPLSRALATGPAGGQPGTGRSRTQVEAPVRTLPAAASATSARAGDGVVAFDYTKRNQTEGERERTLASSRRSSGQKKEAVQPAETAPDLAANVRRNGQPGVRTPLIETNSATKVARLDALTNFGAALRTRFVELPNRAGGRQDVSILGTFQVEQTGQDLNIVDRDGSVYRGQIFSTPGPQQDVRVMPPNLTGATATPNEPFGLAAPPPGANVYYFEVQGTNRTLNAPVVINGRYLEKTNPAPAPENTFSYATNAGRKLAAPADPLAQARRTIIGRATVGQTNSFPLSAISLER